MRDSIELNIKFLCEEGNNFSLWVLELHDESMIDDDKVFIRLVGNLELIYFEINDLEGYRFYRFCDFFM